MKILPIAVVIVANLSAQSGGWSDPAEVRYEDQVCVSYRARLDGPYLVVRATIGPGWHTFAMDNEQRAKEKLAGKQPLSIDKSTEITAAEVESEGKGYQTAPKVLWHPELGWVSWGFDTEARFVAKVAPIRGAASQLTIRGQACTDKICKNVDTSIVLPSSGLKTSAAPSEIDLKGLIPVQN